RRALAETFAQIGQLGAAHVAFAFDFDLIDPRRVHRKDPFDPLAVTDAPHGEGRVQAASAAANDHAGEDLDAFLVAFDHFGVHPHRIATPNSAESFRNCSFSILSSRA